MQVGSGVWSRLEMEKVGHGEGWTWRWLDMKMAEVFEEGLSFRATIILILTSPSVPPKL